MIEIDYLWVGEETKTGDAITLRFTHPDTVEPVVVVIDGGYKDTGRRIVDHIHKYYETNLVDLVVCTHPDDDHIGGLATVVDEMDVKRLLIHRPTRAGFNGDDFKNTEIDALVQLAHRRRTVVDDESFAGATFFGGALVLAGPTEDNYVKFLTEQRDSGKPLEFLKQAVNAQLAKGKEIVNKVFGRDPGESLTDDNGGTSPRNNTSMIFDLSVEGYRALFTGDAGAPALEAAVDFLASLGRDSQPIDFFDIPHHGSRHNLTKDLCDKFLGRVGATRKGSAYVSVGKKAEGHPRPEVANAIRRRGYPVFETRGQNLCWSKNAPARASWGPVTPLDWFEE